MFIIKAKIGNVDNPHYVIHEVFNKSSSDKKFEYEETGLETNGNVINIKCEIEPFALKYATDFAFSILCVLNKNPIYLWAGDPINGEICDYTEEVKHLGQGYILSQLRSVNIYYMRGYQGSSPYPVMDIKTFNKKASNTNEKSKDISTQGEGSKDSNLPLNSSNLTYMGKLYQDFNGNLILKKD